MNTTLHRYAPLLMLAACGSHDSPNHQTPTATSTAMLPAAPLTNTRPATPASTASVAASAPATTIACGKTTCQAGREVCCAYANGKTHACKPAPATPTEDALLRACGSRNNVTAMACDDASDCPSGALCCSPIRHGSDATFATNECLTSSECNKASGIEVCSPDVPTSCTRKGTVCHKNGVCAPASVK